MSDRMLQHVLSDLRPLILPKLRAENDVHLGPGAPANAKKGSVDVHRSDTYQFAFFFRRAESHSVVVKTRTFVAAPRTTKELKALQASSTHTDKAGKRKRPKGNETGIPQTTKKVSKKGKRSNTATRPIDGKGRRAGKGRSEDDEAESAATSDEEQDGEQISLLSSNSALPRRSVRTRKAAVGSYREDDDEETSMTVVDDVETVEGPVMDDVLMSGQDEDLLMMTDSAEESSLHVKVEASDPTFSAVAYDNEEDVQEVSQPQTEESAPPAPIDVEIEDDEEEKPKPILQLSFQGFSIHGRCLCVVVEPWPALRSVSRAPSMNPVNSRGPSIAPPDFIASDGTSSSSGPSLRARTPLFLPDFDRGRSETPAPAILPRIRPPVPLFDSISDDEDDGGLLEFSQALNSIAGERAGSIDEDEDMDGGVFFGDADERRAIVQ